MSNAFQYLLPQTILSVLATLLFLAGTFKVSAKAWPWAALLCLAFTAVDMFLRPGEAPYARGPVIYDQLATGFQWGCLGIGAIFVLLSWKEQSESETAAEFYGLLLLAVAGAMLVSAANDLMLMLLALELISVPTYVILYLGRRDYGSQEATAKYFLLSIFSSAILVYGFALLYGVTSTTNLQMIHTILSPPLGQNEHQSVLGVVALVMIIAGLGFKITAVPFHFYAPDVYQGTSAFNAGLLAVLPKAAGMFALVRIVTLASGGYEASGERIALILAIITMTGGNCLALWQTNVRRLLAYSSVAHAGYMLIGLAVGFWDLSLDGQKWGLNAGTSLPGGVKASLLYLLTYCIASAGMFGVLVYLGRKGRQIEHIEELTGLSRTHPLVAICAAVFLFSMAGMPPLAGFWGKLSLFSSALSVRNGPLSMHQGFTALAVIGVLNAAIAAVYYLKLVAAMFLNEPIGQQQPEGGRGAYAGIMASMVLVVGLGVMPGRLFEYFSQVQLPTPATREVRNEQAQVIDDVPARP